MEYVCRTLSTTELFRLPNSDLGLESETFLNIMYEDFLELILTSRLNGSSENIRWRNNFNQGLLPF